ncbi:DUF6464 family protein [Nostoc sp. C057]
MSPIANATNAIGDRTCKYNAGSANVVQSSQPGSPCEGCNEQEKFDGLRY